MAKQNVVSNVIFVATSLALGLCGGVLYLLGINDGKEELAGELNAAAETIRATKELEVSSKESIE